jgi:hypothetical protein
VPVRQSGLVRRHATGELRRGARHAVLLLNRRPSPLVSDLGTRDLAHVEHTIRRDNGVRPGCGPELRLVDRSLKIDPMMAKP